MFPTYNYIKYNIKVNDLPTIYIKRYQLVTFYLVFLTQTLLLKHKLYAMMYTDEGNFIQ